MKNQKNARSPCELVLYGERPKIRPNSVLYLGNRPGGVHKHHDEVTDFYHLLRDSIRTNRVPSQIEHISERRIRDLNSIIGSHLPEGTFRDTTRIAEWIGAINRYAGWRDAGVPPLELVIAHAESHAEELHHLLVASSSPTKPAGIVLSGSPKMLSDIIERAEGRGDTILDPAVAKTIKIVRWALEQKIPVLGICFGMHMLAYAKFGVIADWLHVPEGMGVEVHLVREGNARFTDVEPCARSMVFGRSRIVRSKSGKVHPVMNAADRNWGLEVHSQFISPELIPPEFVLAASKRLFREGRNASKADTLEQPMLEVFSAGPVAIGTQLHPELQPWLLYVLSHFCQYENELRAEGHNIEAIRERLLGHPEGHNAGQRVGYNFVKRLLAPYYIGSLERLIGKDKARVLRARIVQKDPDLALS